MLFSLLTQYIGLIIYFMFHLQSNSKKLKNSTAILIQKRLPNQIRTNNWPDTWAKLYFFKVCWWLREILVESYQSFYKTVRLVSVTLKLYNFTAYTCHLYKFKGYGSSKYYLIVFLL